LRRFSPRRKRHLLQSSVTNCGEQRPPYLFARSRNRLSLQQLSSLLLACSPKCFNPGVDGSPPKPGWPMRVARFSQLSVNLHSEICFKNQARAEILTVPPCAEIAKESRQKISGASICYGSPVFEITPNPRIHSLNALAFHQRSLYIAAGSMGRNGRTYSKPALFDDLRLNSCRSALSRVDFVSKFKS